MNQVKISSGSKVAAAILLIFLALVVARNAGRGHFRADAWKRAEPSVSRINLINPDSAAKLPGEKLVLIPDSSHPDTVLSGYRKIKAGTGNIFSSGIYSAIRKNQGPVLICSSDPGLSSRIWMLLSQAGIDDLYIVTFDTENEVQKNKIRPDTLLPGRD